MMTAAWIKIEGSFIASGTEDHITIGNFFPNSMVTTLITDYFHIFTGYSYYLIDDVSVTEIDLSADAGPDNWVEELKTIQVGRAGDPTAKALDCKWYHKGTLIDSGAVITVNAGVKGDIDTFAVVQTICGNVKTDTVVISTVGVGMKEITAQKRFSISPNPSDGNVTITLSLGSLSFVEGSFAKGRFIEGVTATLYDLLGRIQMKQLLPANNTLHLKAPSGTYILELRDKDGGIQRERLQLQ